MMFIQPGRSAAAATESDRLMNELGKVEGQLQLWISRSEKNARLFREDPELEIIMRGIAQKLK
jgi:hypothetical protein